MILKDNNLVFDYKGVTLNVPLAEPWKVYEGVTKSQIDYMDKVATKRDFASYITIHLTNRCNLRCKYCFEKDKSNITFSKKDISKVFEFITNNNDSENLEIRFFGGEPFLEFDLLEEFILMFEKLNKKYNLSYNVFTNATILDESKLEVLKKYNIQVFTSIDCNETIHNKNRIWPNGKGTYRLAINNAKKINDELATRITVRSVLDPEDPNWDLVDYCDTLAEQGFGFYSIEFPWTSCNSNFALKEESFKYIEKQISKYCDEYIKRIKNRDFSLIGLHPFGKYISHAINERPILYKYSCGVGYNGLAISPSGDIYPCHAFTEYKEFRLGNISEGITNTELAETFENYSGDNISKCRNCPIKFMCANRCPYDSYEYNGDIKKINEFRCQIQKEVVKASFYLLNEINKLPVQKRFIKSIGKKLYIDKLKKHV